MAWKANLVGLVPFAAMVMVESFDAGLSTVSKAGFSEGMSHFVFVVYSNAIATPILLPSSFLFHRTTRLPLTFSLLCKFFLLSLIGVIGAIVIVVGFYGVIWAQSKAEENETHGVEYRLPSSSDTTPLLQTRMVA